MLFGKKKGSNMYTEADAGGGPVGGDGSYAGGGTGKKKFSPGKFARNMVLILLALVVVYLLGGSVYTLRENEYAVVTTFGVPAVVGEPGMPVKIPFVQQMERVPKTINGFSIGYDKETNESIDAESFMITRDYNFVNVDFYAEYRVTDPVKYMYHSQDPVAILKMLTQSYIRDTIGLYDVDSVITTGKNEIQASIKEKIMTRLDQEDLGIQLVNITIQDAEPPTAEVIDAFKNVENAKQGKETSINKANQKRNEDIPAARAKVDETLKTANAKAEERVNEAKGQVARLNELYAEYKKYPLITKQRMFYETMEDILPDMKVIITKSDGSTQTMLPLESFANIDLRGENTKETEAGGTSDEEN